LLNFYKKAIALRKSLHAVRNGIYKEHFHLNKNLYTFTLTSDKQKVLVVCSFTEKKVKMIVPSSFDIKNAKLILGSYDNTDKLLMPYETRVYLLEN
ncbi:MAG: glucohydrolase, partial [Clostridia bacterium]|nr:glucohydrolase [Clostridia bacterium]